MADQDGVDSAINKLNGTEIDGQEVKVEQARPRYLELIYSYHSTVPRLFSSAA